MPSLRLLVSAIAIAVLVAGMHFDADPAAAAKTDAAKVMSFAKNQVTKPYKWGATGMRRYDCSGLVYRTFAETGLLKKVGGNRKTSRGYYRWFRDRGLITKSPRQGDLVVWGKSRVTHIGIFAGYSSGKPMAFSALHKGVSRHRVHAMNIPLKAYLRVQISR